MVNKEQYFNNNGQLNTSVYNWYRSEYLQMKDCFISKNLEEALEHENYIMDIIRFILEPTIKEDVEYELYKSPYTQLKHYFRKKTGLNAAHEKWLKEHPEEVEEDDEFLF